MSPDVLTIGDIVGTASLDTTILAGGAGSTREVLWAHSCEMSDPAQWLGPHELLMTVGLCVPEDPAGQAAFIARLDDAGLAGVMIGDHEPAPKLSAEMFAEADRRGFPILLTGPHTPYAVIARHVAAANSSAQTLQVLKLSKLYHLAAYADDDAASLVRGLSNLLGVGIEVVDRTTGMSLLDARPPSHSGQHSPTEEHRYPLKGSHVSELSLREFPGEEIDSFLLVHLMKVLEVAVDRILNAADRRAEVSAKLMLGLLNGMATAELSEFLDPHLPSEGFQLVAFPTASARAVARVAAAHRLPIVVGPGRVHHLALVPVGAMTEFRALAEPMAAQAGVSSIFTDYVDTRVAAVEAGKVLTSTQHAAAGWTSFEGSAVSVLTRSHREAQEVVAGVLGPLAEDTARAQSLRETLFAYLRNDRRWTETAAELGIHRQTLSYRLGRIEETTGLSFTRLADLSAAWIAFQAWEVTHAD